jgi:hypothetical protein
MEDIRPQFEYNTDTKKKQDDTDIPYERQISKLENSGTVQEESRLYSSFNSANVQDINLDSQPPVVDEEDPDEGLKYQVVPESNEKKRDIEIHKIDEQDEEDDDEDEIVRKNNLGDSNYTSTDMLRGSQANNSLMNSNMMSMASGDFIRRVDDMSDLGASGMQQVNLLGDSEHTDIGLASSYRPEVDDLAIE